MTYDSCYDACSLRVHSTSHDSPIDPHPPIPDRRLPSARLDRRHRQTARHRREVSRSSHRSMVAYVMDDERMIKSAWTPEVRRS